MPASKNFRILIVDDDPDLIEVMGVKLQAVGFAVFSAPDGQEGIAKAKAVHPDLILLDVQMPKMDGVTALMEIRKDPQLKDAKVLFLTNLGETYDNVSSIDDAIARDIGALGHIQKSEDLDKIVEQVKTAIGAS